MRFSGRTDWELGENDLAAALREARAAGRELVDLTVSNPTVCGFDYDAGLLAPLSEAGAMVYGPEPLGTVRARSAVARYYADAGADVGVERICLTTSTSEAYSFLFRLLCDAGDEVLVARPSYPLFDFLARLDDVRLREYPLRYHDGWEIDLEALEAAVGERTRAVIVVHPNNPTGNFASERERVALLELCARRGLALIVDEVFLDYAVDGVRAESFAAGESAALTFVLSGVSKVCGLPQMKASWIAACGPRALVERAMERLEVVADTFLSMNAPVQYALPAWLAGRGAIQRQILERVRENVDVVGRAANVEMLPLEAGWAGVLRVPQSVAGPGLAEELVRECGVIVHPGAFYGMAGEHWVVVSLIGRAEEFRLGVGNLNRWIESRKLIAVPAGSSST